MAHWVVVAQVGDGDHYRCEEAARFEGTREQARAWLHEVACTHRPRSGLRQQRRDVYRIADGDAYYAVIAGVMATFRVHYQLAEQVWTTGPTANPWQ